MPYIGNQGSIAGFVNQPSKQDLTGASGATLTLTHAVSSAEDISLFINNVRQEPTTSYTVANTTVTLQGYTVSASDDIYVLYNGLTQLTSVPADNSIADAKIAGLSASKLTGALPALDGSNLTGLGGSNVKEVLAMLCDGQNYTVGSGTYTPTNVTVEQGGSNTFSEASGSKITYTPPSCTTCVQYEFFFQTSQNATQHGIMNMRLMIDGAEVTESRSQISSNSMLGTLITFKRVIPIGGSASAATGRQATWTSGKELMVEFRRHAASNEMRLHSTYYYNGAGNSRQFHRPSLIITSYG